MWASLLRNQNVKRGAIALALFFVGSFAFDYFFGPLAFPRLLNGLTIAVALAVLIVYSTVIGKALRSNVPDRVEILTLGIATTFTAILINRVWFTVNVTERELPVYTDKWIVFGLAGLCIGGFMHISATGKFSQALPTMRLKTIMAAAVAASLVFGFFVGRIV